MAKHEQPNPVTKRKNDRKIAEKKEEIKADEKNIETVSKLPKVSRPTHVDNKVKKTPAKPKEGAAALPIEVKNADARAQANQDLNDILSDESLPAPQKERAISRALSLNKPLIKTRVQELGRKFPQVDKKHIENVFSAEAGKRIFKSNVLDNNTWKTAEQNTRRFIKDELGLAKDSRTKYEEGVADEGLEQELADLKAQFNEGIIQDQDLYNELVEETKKLYGLKPKEENKGRGHVPLTTEGEGGSIEQSPEVSRKLSEEETAVKAEQREKEYGRILEGATTEERNNHIDEMMNEFNFRNNTPNLYKLLPESAHSGKAFRGKFKEGNIPVEEWVSYFDKSTETGRKRFNRLKKMIKDNVQETLGDQASTENLTGTSVMDSAFDALESKPSKTDVKRFLPLLGMLKRSFPEVKVIISKSRMIEDFIEAGIDPGKADNVKGYTDGNTVVLNPERLDYETPIHEFGHIWAQATRQLRPDLYAKGVELVKKSPYYLETLEKSKDKDSVYYGYSKARIEEEAMATAIGQAGQQFFKEQSDAKAWDALRKKIWDWISQRLGMKKIEDMTFDQFNKLAVTEILTGERFITEGQAELMENSLIYNALQVPVGSTKNYTPSTKPAVEIDTHGTFKAAALRKEALNTVNRYWDELNNGGWIGYTTGNYGSNLIGTPKFNAKLNAKIESKVDTLRDEFAKEGFTFKRDPKNPGFHIVKKAPVFDFRFMGNLSSAKMYMNESREKLKSLRKKIERYKKLPQTESNLKRIERWKDEVYQTQLEIKGFESDFVDAGGRLVSPEEYKKIVDKARASANAEAKYTKTRGGAKVKSGTSGWKLQFLEDNAEPLRKSIISKINKALKAKSAKDTFKKSKIDKKTRDILNATKLDFQRRGKDLSLQQLGQLNDIVEKTITEGIESNKEILKKLSDKKSATRTFVNDLVNSSEQVDLTQLSKRDLAKYREQKANSLKKDKGIISKFAQMLAPASNNDFYGLLHDLLPKGKTRLFVKKQIDSILVKPLEKANLDYLRRTQELSDQWLSYKADYKNNGGPDLAAKSGITIEKETVSELTNNQVIRLYNYIKDPNLHGQLLESDVTYENMEEIINYVQGNKAMNNLANDIVNLYVKPGAEMNSKLEEHGRVTFSDKIKVDKDNLSDEQKGLLEKIYRHVPNFVSYVPVTAKADETVDTIEHLDSNEFYNPTAMDGRLKERTGQGEMDIDNSNLDSDFDSYLRGPMRTLSFLDFAKNASDFFGAKEFKAMKAINGDTWARSMKDSLARIISGKRTIGIKNPIVKSLDKWINYSVGGIMFLNTRSAVLQLLSTANFAVDNPSLTFNGMRAPKALKDDVARMIAGSPWLKNRAKGKTELALDEIADKGSQNPLDKLLSFGYELTKFGDRSAITLGGVPFATGLYMEGLNKGLSKEQALQEAYEQFVAKAEESQQSTRAERLGSEQATPIGKLILSFANTPMQYNRKMSRALKDLAGLRGVNTAEAKARKAQAGRELLYYGALQNVMFTSLQKIAFAGFGLDSGEEDERRLGWINSMFNTLLRGSGLIGAMAAAIKDGLIAAYQGDDVVTSALNFSPGIATKLRNFKVAANQKAIYPKSELMSDVDRKTAEAIYRTSAAVTGLGLPADKALKLIEQMSDIAASDLNTIEKAFRVAGWERYQLGQSATRRPINSPARRLGKGEMGQAFNDGTIEVDPSLKGEEREDTIKHEQKHADDMKSGKLNYDEKNVYWKGSAFKRQNGKIQYGDKWLKEGDPSLPWEQDAYKAEDSPVKRYVDPDTGREFNPYANQNYTDLSKSADQIDSILQSYNLPTGSPVNKVKRSKEQGKNIWKNQTYHDLGDVDALVMEQLAAYGLPTEDSPLLQTGHGPKEGTPEWEKAVQEGKQFNKDWYSNPIAAELFEQQAPRFKGGAASRFDTIDETHVAEGPASGAVAEYWRNSFPEEGQHKHNIEINPEASGISPELIAHETTHAAGFDYDLGKVAKGILGESKRKDAYGRYLNNPDEQYANLQELRHVLGLRPDQRDLTPEELTKLAEEKGNDDVKAYIENFGVENVAKAHNKVAAVNKAHDKLDNLRSLYSSIDNSIVT